MLETRSAAAAARTMLRIDTSISAIDCKYARMVSCLPATHAEHLRGREARRRLAVHGFAGPQPPGRGVDQNAPARTARGRSARLYAELYGQEPPPGPHRQ